MYSQELRSRYPLMVFDGTRTLQDIAPLEKGESLVEDYSTDLHLIDLYGGGIGRSAVRLVTRRLGLRFYFSAASFEFRKS